jgi:hypothetical protein
MRRVLTLGLATPVPTLARDADTVMFMFLFGCRASTAVGLRESDLTVTDARMMGYTEIATAAAVALNVSQGLSAH